MLSDCITFQNSGYFSKIIVDYLNQSENIRPFYHRFPTLDNFELQIKDKKSFSLEHRKVLVDSLLEQYKHLTASELTTHHIHSLKSPSTFTITTGHQLNLFTGHLYFLYKIVSVINLCKELKLRYPSHNFVPVFWMATEDHDFEEINHFYLHGKKISWNRDASGAVGELSTEGLDEVFEVFKDEIGSSKNAEYLKSLFENAYLKHSNLTDATRYLVNELFSEYGLVIIDGNDKALKGLFAPFVKNELLNQTSFERVSDTIQNFDYPVQVNPREINLFYLDNNLRERIIKEEDTYIVNNTDLRFTEAEILSLVDSHPEKFSPNVIMRPLYQEVILPNLCYTGGGGELAYWLELKSFFEAVNVPFPILLLRNSVLLVTEKQNRKREKLKLSFSDLFEKQTHLINRKAQEFSETKIDFSLLKQQLEHQFELLRQAVLQTDKSFAGAVSAQERKQIKGLENLEKRLLKANKKYFSEQLEQIASVQDQLFPNQTLQERVGNFSEFYESYGQSLIHRLFEEQNPLEHEFNIIVL